MSCTLDVYIFKFITEISLGYSEEIEPNPLLSVSQKNNNLNVHILYVPTLPQNRLGLKQHSLRSSSYLSSTTLPTPYVCAILLDPYIPVGHLKGLCRHKRAAFSTSQGAFSSALLRNHSKVFLWSAIVVFFSLWKNTIVCWAFSFVHNGNAVQLLCITGLVCCLALIQRLQYKHNICVWIKLGHLLGDNSY